MLRNILIYIGTFIGSTLVLLIESVVGLPVVSLFILMRIFRTAPPVAQVLHICVITLLMAYLFPISLTTSALVTAGALLASQLRVADKRRQLAQALISLVGALLIGSLGQMSWTAAASAQLIIAILLIIRELLKSKEASLQLVLDTQWWKRL